MRKQIIMLGCIKKKLIWKKVKKNNTKYKVLRFKFKLYWNALKITKELLLFNIQLFQYKTKNKPTNMMLLFLFIFI